jgi:hypothetical protein
MKLLDRIALNRLIKIITDFILNIITILNKNKVIDTDTPNVPNKPNRFPWLNKQINKVKNIVK